MTEQETIKVVTLIVMSYPSSEKFKDETSLKGMVAVWKTIFKDDNAQLVEMAVQKHISVNKWPPSIAEIREQMIELTRPDIIPPDIAWSMVADVLHTETEYGHFNIHSTFPKPIARVVETIGWHNLYNLHCGSARGNKDGMDRVAFMDLYKPAYEREREQAMLPERIRNVCERKRQEVGGENLKMITDARQKRLEKEQYWENIDKHLLERAFDENETKLLGGNDYEE